MHVRRGRKYSSINPPSSTTVAQRMVWIKETEVQKASVTSINVIDKVDDNRKSDIAILEEKKKNAGKNTAKWEISLDSYAVQCSPRSWHTRNSLQREFTLNQQLG